MRFVRGAFYLPAWGLTPQRSAPLNTLEGLLCGARKETEAGTRRKRPSPAEKKFWLRPCLAVMMMMMMMMMLDYVLVTTMTYNRRSCSFVGGDVAAHNDRAVSMMKHVVADASHDGTSYTAETSLTDHDHRHSVVP